MPEVPHHAFVIRHATVYNEPVTTFFRWDDDPAEDAAFETYINKKYDVSDASVDRSGAEPVLSYTESSTPHSEPAGPVGALWHYSFRAYPSGNFFVTKFGSAVPGYWECDQHGRPFDLNDLLA